MNLLPADGPLTPVGVPSDVELTAARQIGFRPEAVVSARATACPAWSNGST